MQHESFFLNGKSIFLRDVSVEDITDDYYYWLNDQRVNQYLETRFTPQSKFTIRKYVENLLGSKNEIFLAICWRETNKHIGNIKLGPINWIHRNADISLIIGDSDFWGLGVATEAIHLVTEYAFHILNLHKLTAGAYEENTGSIRAFEKNGFKIEGVFKDHAFSNGKYVDIVRLARMNTEKS